MLRSELHYELPPDRIAAEPAEPRDASRLMVLDRAAGTITHRHFRDLGDYLRPPDCLVLNDTRVIPARFFCRRASGGRVEGLFLRAAESNAWGRFVVLLKSAARLRVGERLIVLPRCASPSGDEPNLVLESRGERGEWRVALDPPVDALALLDQVGHTPLPPYIVRSRRSRAGASPNESESGPPQHQDPACPADERRYQTVYAAAPGAVAAPTAGLHFTPELLNCLAAAGIRRTTVTLHVGAGTFQPIEADDLAAHVMHAEWYQIAADSVATLRNVRTGGGRIVAIGTTSARVLESIAGQPVALATEAAGGADGARAGWTNIFIYPPYRFRSVDALLTNFHLPESTLLALVMAFASPDLIRRAYQTAMEERYRFYSYGDAMLIL